MHTMNTSTLMVTFTDGSDETFVSVFGVDYWMNREDVVSVKEINIDRPVFHTKHVIQEGEMISADEAIRMLKEMIEEEEEEEECNAAVAKSNR